MGEQIGSHERVRVSADGPAIARLYADMFCDVYPEGEEILNLGATEISEPRFSFARVETQLTLRTPTAQNLQNLEELEAAERRAFQKGGPMVLVIPDDLPGYKLQTLIVQRGLIPIFNGEDIEDIAQKLERVPGLVVKERQKKRDVLVTDIYCCPARYLEEESELRFRVHFPWDLEARISWARGDPFAIMFYVFPGGVWKPRYAGRGTEQFERELNDYCWVLEETIGAVFGNLEGRHPEMTIPDVHHRLTAPEISLVDQHPDRLALSGN